MSTGYRSSLPIPFGVGRTPDTTFGFVGLPWFRGGTEPDNVLGFVGLPWFRGGTAGIAPPVEVELEGPFMGRKKRKKKIEAIAQEPLKVRRNDDDLIMAIVHHYLEE